MQQKLNHKHIPSLNLLRGLAALSVCCFHILSETPFGFLNSIFKYGYLGLDLFFIISGFVIPYAMFQNDYSWNRFPKFLLKRSIRIEPPYIISFLLIITMRILHGVINHWQTPSEYFMHSHDWTQFGLHFFYLNQYFGYEPYTVVYWTLAIEFQFYLLIGLLYPLLVSSKKVFPILLFVFFCTLIWFLNLPYNWFIFQYGYLFITGILIFLYTVKHISLRWFLVLLAIVFTLLYFKNGFDVLLLAIFGATAIIGIKHEWKLSNFFGKISYSFYLIHIEAAGWFIIYMRPIVNNEFHVRILAVLFAIVFAIGFYYLFEKPAFNLSKKILYNKKKLA